MSKRIRILLVCAVALVAVLAIALTVLFNIHSIFLWTQRIGLFKAPIEIKKADMDNLSEYSISESGLSSPESRNIKKNLL